MKKIIVSGALCTLAVFGGANAAFAEETTTTAAPKTQADMLAQIQELMKLIASLQEQINAAKGAIQELAVDLDLGAKNDDVLKAQEILASDPALFGVKPTGYFGPMTQVALKKFQERYGLEVTGKLDEATRDAMKELRKERKDGIVPAGLIKSDEVKDRIKARLAERWGKDADDDSEDDMDDDDSDDMDDDSDEDDTTPVTREEARVAVVDAQKELNAFRGSIDDMENDDATDEEIKTAEKTFRDAQKEMSKARRALAKRDFSDAVTSADEVLSLINGDDAEDDSEDDMDDDSEDDSDEDEDSEEDEDDSDDEDDDAEDDD